jgi:glycosyltransferase involved in cell wall biosynthesis
MKVIQVLAPAAFGGLERVVEGLSAGLSSRGHDVLVCAVVHDGDRPHPFVRSLTRADIPTEVIQVGARAYLEERKRMVRVFRAFGPDVVHTHGYRPDVIGGSAARAAGARAVSTVHGFTGGGIKNRLNERMQLLSLRRVDAVIAVSEPLRRTLVATGVPADRVHVVQNAWIEDSGTASRVEARRQLALPHEGLHLCWVGRVSREKGLDVAVRALALLARPDVFLSILGEGPEEAEVRALAEELGCSHKLTWHGNVPQAGRWLAAFDGFVLSSRTEGTPMVLFEAMAAQIPIVATRVGGVPDVLDQETAMLVPSEDAESLAAGIAASLAAGPEPRARVLAARAKLVQDHGSEDWVRKHERLYAPQTSPPPVTTPSADA